MSERRHEIRGAPGWWTVWVALFEDVDSRRGHYTMWKRVGGPFLRRRNAERFMELRQ